MPELCWTVNAAMCATDETVDSAYLVHSIFVGFLVSDFFLMRPATSHQSYLSWYFWPYRFGPGSNRPMAKPSFSQIIRDAREKRRCTMAEVAERVGVSVAAIYMWKN
jgi:hypothetical protein